MTASTPFLRPMVAASHASALRGSAQFRFCSGRCQDARPPEGGVELSPGKWRCSACWIEMARKRQ